MMPTLRAAIIVLLVMAPAGSGDYLMRGYDAQRTGNSPDSAPAWGDIAFQRTVAGTAAYMTGPIVIGREAFVLAPGATPGDGGGLFRIDLDMGTGADVPIVPLHRNHPTFDNPVYISDGSTILVARNGLVEWYGLDGDPMTSLPVDPLVASSERSWMCFNPALKDGTAYIPCNEIGFERDSEGEMRVVDFSLFILVVEMTASGVTDRWVIESASQGASSSDGTVPAIPAPRICTDDLDAPCPTVPVELIYGVTVGESHVTATTAVGGHYSAVDPSGRSPDGTAYSDQRIVSLDKATGDVVWAHRLTEDTEGVQGNAVSILPSPLHLYDDGVVSYIFEDLFHRNAIDGSPAGENFLGTGDPEDRDFGGTMATDGLRYFTASHNRIRSYDSQWEQTGSASLPRPGSNTGLSPLLVADGILFAQSDEGDSSEVPVLTQGRVRATNTSVNAFDAATLEPLWDVTVAVEVDLPISASSFAVANGLIVQVTRDGVVTVIGETPASLTPSFEASTEYPAVGEEFSVDLAKSGGGVDGEPSWYRADWGDGTPSVSSREPVLYHAYESQGEYVARFEVANDAGQTASRTMTFHAGADPPAKPGLIQRMVSSDGFERILLIAALLLVAIVATAEGARLAQRRRERQSEGREDRESAYRRVLSREIELGTEPKEIAERLRPMRGVLGITDREHALLEAEVRSLRVAAAGGARVLVPGERFLDRYEVKRKIGSGGGGMTYLCVDDRLGRTVVLKVLRTDGPDAATAALQEARAFAAVHHDRVVTIHDVEHLGDDVYLVLEFVDGPSLAEQIEKAPLDTTAMRRLADDLLSALQAVHRSGLIHRDVKPSNILVAEDGSYTLGDFGLALGNGEEETFVGLQGGTAKYMAPEQARGGRVDARSDLYSAALTLYEAWTGHAFNATKTQGAGPMASGSPLHEFFERALSSKPSARFQNAASMRKALLRLLGAS